MAVTVGETVMVGVLEGLGVSVVITILGKGVGLKPMVGKSLGTGMGDTVGVSLICAVGDSVIVSLG